MRTFFFIIVGPRRNKSPVPYSVVMSSTTRYPSLPPEDWDHLDSPTIDSPTTVGTTAPSRVIFPSHGPPDDTPVLRSPRASKRTLSELLKLHAEKGTDVHFSAEEASRLEEVLGQWVSVYMVLPLLDHRDDGPLLSEDKLRPVTIRGRGRLFSAVAGRYNCALPPLILLPLNTWPSITRPRAE